MSKLTLDEAIKHCLEVAEQKEHDSITTTGDYELDIAMKEGCIQCATDHRQLAEWLTELKKLREENINLKNDNERLRDCVDSCVFNGELDYAELAEAKRLLKAAVEDFSNTYDHIFDCDAMCDTCPLYGERDHCLKWRYADKALKLIGDEPNGV